MQYEYKIEQFNEKGFVKGEVKWRELEDRLNALGVCQDIRPLPLGGSQSVVVVVVFMKRETA